MTSYDNLQLIVPEDVSDTNYLPNTSICGYWDDLVMLKDTPQGIYYQIDGEEEGNRTITFEYYATKYHQTDEYSHFLIRYDEAVPGVMEFDYYQTTGMGESATIGVQSRSNNVFVQYEFNTPDSVMDCMRLTVDTNENTIVSGNI